MITNATEKLTVADNCCSICSKASCEACPMKDLVSADYEEVVALLLEGFSAIQVSAMLAGNIA